MQIPRAVKKTQQKRFPSDVRYQENPELPHINIYETDDENPLYSTGNATYCSVVT